LRRPLFYVRIFADKVMPNSYLIKDLYIVTIGFPIKIW